MTTKHIERVGIENVKSPGRIVRVDAVKYETIKRPFWPRFRKDPLALRARN
jgi:hypothetical protein